MFELNRILIEIFNPDLKVSILTEIPISLENFIPGVSFAGPSCTEKGTIEMFNPRSIARNFQPGRPQSNSLNPLGVAPHRHFSQFSAYCLNTIGGASACA